MSALAVDELVDLSDLDLLDEQHVFCKCNGLGPKVAIAACGRRGFMRGLEVTPAILAEVCVDCREDWKKPCARCGE